MFDDQIARVTHAVNKAICESVGDTSQVAWEEAPDWQRQSAINDVQYAKANPAAKPEDSHINWMNQKTADGWVYGAVKDPVAKTHPAMVPYDELPGHQRAKDFVFLAVVRALTS